MKLEQHAAGRIRVVHVPNDDRSLRVGRERTDVFRGEIFDELEDLVGKSVGDFFLHVHALDGRAILPCVRERAPHDAVRGAIEVRVRKHDRCVFSAELERAR